MTELKYKDISEKIIGASPEVHKFLYNACLPDRQGFPEVIYQRALGHELREAGLLYKREIEQNLYCKNLPNPIGKRRADFVDEEKVLVELKAVMEFNDASIAQTLNYPKAYQLEVALLINFESKSLTFKRLIL